jgi:hypothetical protein
MFKAARVCVLVVLLSCSVRAGYIPNGLSEAAQPPPPPPAVEEEPTPEGDDGTTEGLTGTLTEAALLVLNSVLTVL